jgi:hypothetical protein
MFIIYSIIVSRIYFEMQLFIKQFEYLKNYERREVPTLFCRQLVTSMSKNDVMNCVCVVGGRGRIQSLKHTTRVQDVLHHESAVCIQNIVKVSWNFQFK